MSNNMRKIMDSFEDYQQNIKQREVVVSYDITAEYSKFRSDLLAILDNYGKEGLTMSTYKLGTKLNGKELENLISEIKEKFQECKAQITESNRYKKQVKVIIITSLDNTFFTETVVNEVL